tara:strand:+ start:1847 stop:2602 length:756 start_codon:yes stop_codon:yes gene_type:complete
MVLGMIFAAKFVDFILPPRCIVTGDIVDKQGMLSSEAWAGLRFISQPQCDRCGIPFDFEHDVQERGEGADCAACLREPPIYNKARSALVYDEASRELILPFKHGDKTHFILGFLPWLKQTGGMILEEVDLIMPVPLHRWRLLQRRFNQAGIMASYLSKEVGKSCCLDGLQRVRSTPTQGHMRAKERKKNVKRAFAVNHKYTDMIKGKRICLIDDVYTTGATVNECAQTLLNAGAIYVDVLTLARVVKPVNG